MGSTRSDAPSTCSIGYDRRTGAYYATYDPTGGDSPVVDVVRAVSAIAGVPPCELEPLHEHVDPDALNALFGPHRCDASPPGVEICFTFHGHLVVVDGAGGIAIHPPRPSAREAAPPFDDRSHPFDDR